MEQLYVETNKVDEYIAYTKTLTNMQIQTASSEDSLVYVTAELQYMMGNHQEAAAGLTTYLTSFCPGGRYCTNATYYAANSFYQLKQYDKAIEQYSALADVQGNPYMEEACMRVAELSYDKQEYRTALYYFQRMSEVAYSSSQRTTALLGMLRCGSNIADKSTVLDVATRLLDEPALDSVVRNEALYCRAKAHLENQQYGLALVDLTPVAKVVRTAQGAEAKYLLATCYYQLGAIDMAEQEIMAFTQKQTSHQYWLAKSFILLSDIYVEENRDFEAKQYLLSVRENYSGTSDISTEIKIRLEKIENKEAQKVVTESSNETPNK
jgi:TolA-binding protein